MCPACILPIASIIVVIIALIYLCGSLCKDAVGRVVAAVKKGGSMVACRLGCLLPLGRKKESTPKSAEEPPSGPATEFVSTSPVPMGTEIKPPIGPTKDLTFTDEGKNPATDIHPKMFVPLPRGGLSCPNKRWYDSIYNGGVATEIAIPNIEEDDMKKLWRKDYRSVGYNGQFAWGDDREPRTIDEGRVWRNMFV